jgi:hypothetical protein
LFRVIDEGADGGEELVVIVDEGLDMAAVDDAAVLGGDLAEAGHDGGGQLGQADIGTAAVRAVQRDG